MSRLRGIPAHLVTGTAAVALAADLAAWLGVEAQEGAGWPIAGVGLAGAVAVAAGLVWPATLAAGLTLPAAAYVLVLVADDPSLDERAVVVAIALVVVAGLADWSIELRTTSPDEPGGRWRRLLAIAVAGLGTLAVGGVLLALADVARADGLGIDVLGMLAALAALGLLVRLASPRPRKR